MLREHRFRAMNTDVAAWLWSDSVLASVRLGEVETLFAQVEAELSRFRPDSGLSRLNRRAGAGPQRVSSLLQTVLSAALDAAGASDGIFDPTVLAALNQAGYDRSFDLLASANRHGQPTGRRGTVAGDAWVGQDAVRTGEPSQSPRGIRMSRCMPGPDWTQVQLDPNRGLVELPAGVEIDLGGIAKGWTVDRAAEFLAPWGAALVDAGGDIRGTAPPGGEPWPIAIQDPFDSTKDLLVVTLTDGAIATSSTGKRRWQRDGEAMHHLIDPRSGLPSQSDLHTVTVLAPTAAEAEVAAKAALILGRRAGKGYLDQRGLTGVLIGGDRSVEVVGMLPPVSKDGPDHHPPWFFGEKEKTVHVEDHWHRCGRADRRHCTDPGAANRQGPTQPTCGAGACLG